MRLAFMGSPDFSVPALHALRDAGNDIAAVYCQPPRPAGRGQSVRRCPVHVAADGTGVCGVAIPARAGRILVLGHLMRGPGHLLRARLCRSRARTRMLAPRG